jgi:integrase
MSVEISTKTARKKLKPRREPYWARLSTGIFLGYRVADSGEGTWIARIRADDGKQKYHALGTFEDFDAAKARAEEIAGAKAQGVEQFDATVGDALRSYVAHLRAEKNPTSAADAERRFATLIYGQPLERVPLAKLQTRHVRDWRDALAEIGTDDEDDPEAIRRAKRSANRNLDALKAALNLALRDRLVTTDAGWKTVFRFKDVNARRERFLTLAERRALLAACPRDLADLCTAMLLTAARPGELAAADVADFDATQGTLVLDGKTGRRLVSLSTGATEFFRERARGAIAKAPLLRRAAGQRWAKDGWKKTFKTAARVAGLPDDVVLYSLRHAAISEFIAGGMDSFLVARLAGTSTAMIDKHYGHLRHDRTRAAMDAVKMV